MSDLVFLNDALMARDAFESLPAITADGASLAAMIRHAGGKLCRVLIERDGRHEWHAAAWLYLNGAERIAAARIRFGKYQQED